MMKLACSTLVLDLDGTISDPSLGVTRCFNHALQSHGFPTVLESVIAKEIGPPLDETFFKLTPGISASDVKQLIAKYRERYADIGYSENRLYDGIPEALEKLKNKNIVLGVCTAKRRDFAKKILQLFDLFEYFSFIEGGDIGITKASQLARLLNANIIDHDAIMVGDRSVDITSAHKNSLDSIGVLWGFGDHTELSTAKPSRILKKVEELPDVLI